MKTNYLFTAFVLLVIGLVGPMVISDFVGAKKDLSVAQAESYMQSHCEELSNAAQTQYWYECDREGQ